MKKLLIIGGSIVFFVAILVWAFIQSSQPLPGEAALQDGRNHVPEGSPLSYKFNPPTSGDHYPSWITKGFYDEPRPDGNVVHSEEHGYIIIWYDCEKASQLKSLIPTAYAQGMQMTAGSEGSPSARLQDLPDAFRNGACDNLKSQLRGIYNQDQHKIIVMPRVGMDYPIIITAWGRMEKLGSVDKAKVKGFIDAFRDHAPEQTDEP